VPDVPLADPAPKPTKTTPEPTSSDESRPAGEIDLGFEGGYGDVKVVETEPAPTIVACKKDEDCGGLVGEEDQRKKIALCVEEVCVVKERGYIGKPCETYSDCAHHGLKTQVHCAADTKTCETGFTRIEPF
jgi:hypothetical protein